MKNINVAEIISIIAEHNLSIDDLFSDRCIKDFISDYVVNNFDVCDLFDDDKIIKYAEVNFYIDEIFGDEEIIGFVSSRYNPEDVFSLEDLENWYEAQNDK